jgi:hypothetical protein
MNSWRNILLFQCIPFVAHSNVNLQVETPCHKKNIPQVDFLISATYLLLHVEFTASPVVLGYKCPTYIWFVHDKAAQWKPIHHIDCLWQKTQKLCAVILSTDVAENF